MRLLKYFLLLPLLQFACQATDATSNLDEGYALIDAMQNIALSVQLPQKFENAVVNANDEAVYMKALDSTTLLIAESISYPKEKILINCYAKSQFGSSNYYSFSNSVLDKTNKLPQHIQDRFDGVFKCYSADYLSQFPASSKGVGFPHEASTQLAMFFEIKLLE